jgi:hypothetical protein
VNTPSNSLGVIGGYDYEIILIWVLLFILLVAAAAFAGLIYLIVRAVQKRPPPAPSPIPPEVLVQAQQKRDREHLKLLSIFHFVVAGLALAVMGFLCVHYLIMHTVLSNPDMWKSQKGAFPPPKAFLDAFVWFYVFMGVILLAGLVLNVLSGLFLWQKRHRVFSLVIGGLNCLQIPFGTALGVFTIIVLGRESVRGMYSDETSI